MKNKIYHTVGTVLKSKLKKYMFVRSIGFASFVEFSM